MTDTEDCFHQLGTLCAYQTAQSEDFSLSQRQVDVLEGFRQNAGQSFDFQDHVSRYIILRRIYVRQFPSYHLGDDHVRSQVFGFPCSDVLSVTHDRYLVGNS